ncbi:PAS domain-containing protein [Polaromonas sp. SM01]|uniref:PAS domain-containing protein n=1 Tax=Polaromonas sp. SM01 TaxID=3085630 RepID=UPI002980F498|nr:PAS domain-containing protein [Polaromonas sp. SM01]MDW5444770.1 PAS domain-containing protein [Polaromonas sp. SM01]
MQSTTDLKQLVEAVGDAIVASDAGGAITLWNPAAQRMFGFTEEEALGQSLDLIIPQRQQQRHWDGYHRTMATGKTRYGNDVLRVPAVHKDGHGLSIAFTVALLHAPDGQVSAIVAVIRDETSRFAEERGLRKRLMELESQITPSAAPL